jgi:hypothetical protein
MWSAGRIGGTFSGLTWSAAFPTTPCMHHIAQRTIIVHSLFISWVKCNHKDGLAVLGTHWNFPHYLVNIHHLDIDRLGGEGFSIMMDAVSAKGTTYDFPLRSLVLRLFVFCSLSCRSLCSPRSSPSLRYIILGGRHPIPGGQFNKKKLKN